jgi:threonine/homoserine/homoserine lactone efflux protein
MNETPPTRTRSASWPDVPRITAPAAAPYRRGELWGFAQLALVMSITPGPDDVLVAGGAVRGGPRLAAATASGSRARARPSPEFVPPGRDVLGWTLLLPGSDVALAMAWFAVLAWAACAAVGGLRRQLLRARHAGVLTQARR